MYPRIASLLQYRKARVAVLAVVTLVILLAGREAARQFILNRPVPTGVGRPMSLWGGGWAIPITNPATCPVLVAAGWSSPSWSSLRTDTDLTSGDGWCADGSSCYTDGDRWPACSRESACVSPIQTSGWTYEDMRTVWGTGDDPYQDYPIVHQATWHEDYFFFLMLPDAYYRFFTPTELETRGEVNVKFGCRDEDCWCAPQVLGEDPSHIDDNTVDTLIEVQDTGFDSAALEDHELVPSRSSMYYAGFNDVEESVYYASVVRGDEYGLQVEERCGEVLVGDPACNQMRWNYEHDWQFWTYEIWSYGASEANPQIVFSTRSVTSKLFGDKAWDPNWMRTHTEVLVHSSAPRVWNYTRLYNDVPVRHVVETGCWGLLDLRRVSWSPTDWQVVLPYDYLYTGTRNDASIDRAWSEYYDASSPARLCPSPAPRSGP